MFTCFCTSNTSDISDGIYEGSLHPCLEATHSILIKPWSESRWPWAYYVIRELLLVFISGIWNEVLFYYFLFLQRSFSYGKIHIFELWRTTKYHTHPTYLNTSGPCQTDSIIWNNFSLLSSCTKKKSWKNGNKNPDQTLCYAASDQGHHCLLRPVRPNAWEYGNYGKYYSIYQHRVTWIVENSVIWRHVVYASFYLYKCGLVRWPGASGFCYVLM